MQQACFSIYDRSNPNLVFDSSLMYSVIVSFRISLYDYDHIM